MLCLGWFCQSHHFQLSWLSLEIYTQNTPVIHSYPAGFSQTAVAVIKLPYKWLIATLVACKCRYVSFVGLFSESLGTYLTASAL